MTFILTLLLYTAFPRCFTGHGCTDSWYQLHSRAHSGGEDPSELITDYVAGIAGGAFVAGLFSGTFTRITAQGKAVYWAIVARGASIAVFGLFGWFAIRAATQV